MKLHGNLQNKNGKLYVGGVSADSLATQYGTPLYVYDEERIRHNIRTLFSAYKKYYPKFKLYYAVKANSNLNILRIMKSEGCGVDVNCPAEMHLAKISGFAGSEMMYSGNNQKDSELQAGLDYGVIMNLDDITHLSRVLKLGMPKVLSFRYNPGMGSDMNEKLIFAGPEAKFGVPPWDIIKAYETAKKAGVTHFGIHMMTGSAVMDANYFEQITRKMFEMVAQIKQKLDIDIEFIDLGGSLGIPYKPDQKALDVETVAKKVCSVAHEFIQKYNLKIPYLVHEPGRYLVCDAGILLARVTTVKKSYKTFVGCDAGMSSLIRPAMYGSYHEILVANKLDAPKKSVVSIVGPLCENSDQFAKDRKMPYLVPGDLLAICDTGAYGFSMASHYNSRPLLAEVLVHSGKSDIIRARETPKDLYRHVTVLPRLAPKIAVKKKKTIFNLFSK